jgi:hypothetical protein
MEDSDLAPAVARGPAGADLAVGAVVVAVAADLAAADAAEEAADRTTGARTTASTPVSEIDAAASLHTPVPSL